MGNGMMCITTPETGVMQGDANTVIKGAAPPPPPTGAVGGGDALHLSAVVVMQLGMAGHPHPQSPVPPVGPSGCKWVQRGANVVANAGPNAVTRLAQGGRKAGSSFLSPKKSGENDG